MTQRKTVLNAKGERETFPTPEREIRETVTLNGVDENVKVEVTTNIRIRQHDLDLHPGVVNVIDYALKSATTGMIVLLKTGTIEAAKREMDR